MRIVAAQEFQEGGAARDALLAQKVEGMPTRLTAFRMTSQSPPPRPHYGIWQNGTQVGEVCSGGVSPSLGQGIGMAYLDSSLAKPDTEIEIDVRGRHRPARVESRPLYDPDKAPAAEED